jgi:hypothetical protein
MQRLLSRTGFFERVHLRAQVIGAQEVIRDAQAPGWIAF